MASTGGRCGARYRRIRRAVIARAELVNAPCSYCGGGIDYRFSRAFPRHRNAVVVDHIRELCIGGDLYDVANLTVMHWGCNSGKSNSLRIGSRYKRKGEDLFVRVPSAGVAVTSRRW